jgi:hypothetical protein
MPGVFGENARLDLEFRVGAADEVLREQRLALRVRQEVLVEILEMLFALLAVAVPPDGVLGQRIDNSVLVLRRTAGVMAGFGAERTARDNRSLAVADCVLVQRSIGQIPTQFGEMPEAEFVSSVRVVPHTRFSHANLPNHTGCRTAPRNVLGPFAPLPGYKTLV